MPASAERASAPPSLAEVLPDTYGELRRVARGHLRRLRAGQTLNTTALVHEAYLKLAGGPAGSGRAGGQWNDRNHFIALASVAMRQLVVDHARRRHAGKRGGGALMVTLEDDAAALPDGSGVDVLALDAALSRLGALDPALERLVECRFFAGLSMAETALALDRSLRSVERDWARARAYLFQALRE